MNAVRQPLNLSPQQKCVLDGRRRGLSYKEIGEELGISKNTVKQHLKRIFAKTGTHSSLAAVSVSVERVADWNEGRGFEVRIQVLPAVKKAA